MKYENSPTHLKSVAIFMALMLALGLCFPGSASAAEPATVTISAPAQSIGPGEQFTISINVEPNNAIAGMQFDLNFDPSLVAANDVAEGNLLSQDGASTYFNPGTINNQAGTITGVFGAIITPSETISNGDTFATITMISGTTEGGTCPFTLSNVIIGTTDGQSVPVNVTYGEVTISGNRRPVLDPIGNKTIDEGQLLKFTISASDPDGDGLSFYASNLPEGASFDPGTRTFFWTPSSGQDGSYPNVHFEVSDGELTDSEEITITVNRRSSSGGGGGGGGGSTAPSNDAPVLNIIGDKSVCGGQLLEFTVSATDPDDDPLTYSASNLPPGASFDPETRTFSWTPASGQAGSYPAVHFEVSDGKLADSEEITITVNNPPVLNTIGDKYATEEELLEFTISGADPDDDPLTYSVSNLPPGASFNPETRTFSWTPASGQAGSYLAVHFEVSDSALTDFEDITITVHKPDKIPPEIGEVVASEINPDSVEICWTTDEPSTSQVKYWASPSKVTPLDEILVTHHVVRLTDLAPGTTYYYKTLSRDEKGNLAVSSRYTFTTPTTSDAFVVSELDITPIQADTGEEVTVSVLITNTSDITGDYEVTLSIDNVAEATEQIVNLAGGASQWITFTTVKSSAGTFMLSVNVSLVVKDAAGAAAEMSLLRVNYRIDIETGKLASARVGYQVAESYESMDDVELVLAVNLDGKPLETVPLLSSSQLEPDGITGSFDYIPSQGWRSGTYTFQALLYKGEQLLDNTNIDNLEVTPGFIVREVEWMTLGTIIGAALIVIAVSLLYVLYSRRRMLTGHIADA